MTRRGWGTHASGGCGNSRQTRGEHARDDLSLAPPLDRPARQTRASADQALCFLHEKYPDRTQPCTVRVGQNEIFRKLQKLKDSVLLLQVRTEILSKGQLFISTISHNFV